MLNWSHVETLNGVLVVDKPSSWTSHDVVSKVRRFTGTKKVGHLGTLDPMATGVLPLLIGRATRLAQFFGKADKVYEGTIAFGYATDTYDAEGKATSESVPVTLDPDFIEDLWAGSGETSYRFRLPFRLRRFRARLRTSLFGAISKSISSRLRSRSTRLNSSAARGRD